MARIQHNDLTHYFMTPHEELPASYLSSCKKFFDSICWPGYYGGTNTKGKIYKLKKPQAAGRTRATSNKLQAASAMKRTQLKGINKL